MLLIRRRQLAIQVSDAEFVVLVDELAAQGFQGVLRSAEISVVRAFGVEDDFRIRNTSSSTGVYSGRDMSFGEIFSISGCLLYVKEVGRADAFLTIVDGRPRRADVDSKLEFGVIAQSTNTKCFDELDKLSVSIRSILTRIKNGVEIISEVSIETGRDPRSAFRNIAQGREPKLDIASFTDADYRISKILADKKMLELARRVSQVRSVPSGEIDKAISDAKIAKDRFDLLTEEGFFVRNRVLECRQTSAQLVSLGQIGEADLLPQDVARLLCPKCGKSLSDERSTYIYDLGAAGKNLIIKSHWLTVLVTDALERLGINRDNILWNIEEGADEVDILAAFRGQVWIFELKDREFGAGDAHKFSFRRSRLLANKAFIVTTEIVSSDAKEVFREVERQSRASRIDSVDAREPVYIEGLDSLEENLKKAAVQSASYEAAESLASFNGYSGFNVTRLLSRLGHGAAVEPRVLEGRKEPKLSSRRGKDSGTVVTKN